MEANIDPAISGLSVHEFIHGIEHLLTSAGYVEIRQQKMVTKSGHQEWLALWRHQATDKLYAVATIISRDGRIAVELFKPIPSGTTYTSLIEAIKAELGAE